LTTVNVINGPTGVIVGLGVQGYLLALRYLATLG
jgi:3-dehydroquinate dehydratase